MKYFLYPEQFLLNSCNFHCNLQTNQLLDSSVAYPGILFGGGGVQQIQLRTEDRQNRDLGTVAPQSRGGFGTRNLISYSKMFLIFVYGDNQFICHCKRKTIANLGSFRILLPFYRTSWGVGVQNSLTFKIIRMLE